MTLAGYTLPGFAQKYTKFSPFQLTILTVVSLSINYTDCSAKTYPSITSTKQQTVLQISPLVRTISIPNKENSQFYHCSLLVAIATLSFID